jgi:hypothetical protein
MSRQSPASVATTDKVQRGQFHRTLNGCVCRLSDRRSPAFVAATVRSPSLLAPTRDRHVCHDRQTPPRHRQTRSSGHIIAPEHQMRLVPGRWTHLSRRTTTRPTFSSDRRWNRIPGASFAGTPPRLSWVPARCHSGEPIDARVASVAPRASVYCSYFDGLATIARSTCFAHSLMSYSPYVYH